MASEEAQAYSIRCQWCGQPLDVTPESIVVVCKYCGRPNWLVQAATHPIVLIPGISRGLDRIFRRYVENDPDMKKIADKVTLKRANLSYIPLYTVNAVARGKAWGVADVVMSKIEVKRVDGRTETRVRTFTVEVSVSETYELFHTIDVVARRNYDNTIIDPLVKYYASKGRPYRELGKPIEQVNWEEVKGEVLAAEIGPADAQRYARDEACDRSYSIVKDSLESKAKDKALAEAPAGSVPTAVNWKVLKIPCRSEVTSMSPVVLLPVIEAVYSYQGKMYKAVFAGWNGERVYGEEPVFASQRLLSFGGGALLGGLLAGGGLSAALLPGAGGLVRALGGLGVLLGMAASYYLAKESLKDVRVEEVE